MTLTLMYLDFEVVFLLPIYTRKQPNTMKVWWSGKWYMWWLESNEQPFVSLCSASNHWTLAWKWQMDFSCSAMRTLALDKKCFFRIKKSDNSIVNKRVETFVPEFSGISPEFSTNQNFWECTFPLNFAPLNGQLDINLEKSLQRSKISNFSS